MTVPAKEHGPVPGKVPDLFSYAHSRAFTYQPIPKQGNGSTRHTHDLVHTMHTRDEIPIPPVHTTSAIRDVNRDTAEMEEAFHSGFPAAPNTTDTKSNQTIADHSGKEIIMIPAPKEGDGSTRHTRHTVYTMHTRDGIPAPQAHTTNTSRDVNQGAAGLEEVFHSGFPAAPRTTGISRNNTNADHGGKGIIMSIKLVTGEPIKVWTLDESTDINELLHQFDTQAKAGGSVTVTHETGETIHIRPASLTWWTVETR